VIAKELGAGEDLFECRSFMLDNFVPRKEVIDTVIKLKDKFIWGVFSDQTNWIYEYDSGYTKYDDEFYRIP